MMPKSKYLSKWTTALIAAILAVAVAPVSKAAGATTAENQPVATAPGSATTPAPAATTPSAEDTQARLQSLESEIGALEKELASLKESAAAQPQPAPVTAQAPAADAPAKINLAGLLGATTLSGTIDTYYGFNGNHPGSNLSGLRVFDGTTNGFGFNMAELIMDKAIDPMGKDEGKIGYHVSAGYGEAARAVNGSDVFSTDGSNFYIKEAYVSYLASVGKGLTFTVGKFVTPAGAEVIETNANWNYSRSILFYYAIPYFHFGASAKYTFNPKFALTGYLVNGWNNTVISHSTSSPNGTSLLGQSSGLTYGVSAAFTPNAKWSVIENYFAGPVISAYRTAGFDVPVKDWKQLSDTVIMYTPNMKWSFMVNGDYGYGPRYYTVNGAGTVVTAATSPATSWWGVAPYVKYAWSPKSYLAVRYEYYGDPDGYTGLAFGSRAHAQEVTTTYAYNVTSGFQLRGEYRYDFASLPIFEKGPNESSIKEQSTAVLGFIYTFSSANAK